MTARSKFRRPRYVLDHRGVPIPRDTSEFECWLAVHGQTRGGAYIVSRDGDRANAVTVPIALLDLGPPCGALERENPETLRLERVMIRRASGPGFIFDEKGLR